MIVLLDTDVLLDAALDRRPFSDPAVSLLDALYGRPGTAFMAWHTLSNLHYLITPHRNASEARSFVEQLLAFVQIPATGTRDALNALHLPMRDFEDAFQAAAALACGADVIATRNVKDYLHSPVPGRPPEAVLKSLAR